MCLAAASPIASSRVCGCAGGSVCAWVVGRVGGRRCWTDRDLPTRAAVCPPPRALHAEAPAAAEEQLEVLPIRVMEGKVVLPGSKSLSNRILLLAALAEGTTEVLNILVSQGATARTWACGHTAQVGARRYGGCSSSNSRRTWAAERAAGCLHASPPASVYHPNAASHAGGVRQRPHRSTHARRPLSQDRTAARYSRAAALRLPLAARHVRPVPETKREDRDLRPRTQMPYTRTYTHAREHARTHQIERKNTRAGL